MRFDFALSTEIVFGSGRISSLPEVCARFGRRVFLVHGASSAREGGVLDRIRTAFAQSGLTLRSFKVASEPEAGLIDRAAEAVRKDGCDVVAGLGGGSCLDTAKAAAALARNGGSVADYLEGVGTGRKLVAPSLPFVAAPTTAGTGAEATENAVISEKARRFKKSIRSRLLRPAVALVDPALTLTCPPEVTAACGLDALTQLIEPFLSKGSQPMTDALAVEGMRLAGRSLPRVFENGSDLHAREEMSLASLLGGICLANARLGAVHGIAAALGALHGIGHGLACAVMLPHVLKANLDAAGAASPGGPLPGKFGVIARCLSGDARRAEDDAVRLCAELCAKMKIPPLSRLGVTPQDIPAIIEASRGSSMKFNPVDLPDRAIAEALEKALAGPLTA